ncbi:uncharacterized protein LOC131889887 isoform X1 [Tigriopus californicus]|uniref:uncharacterized protein LOC131889887 isoform X1 n=1 Tax=Tigriopus californicus TaxID=6832 RepID=UPI0027DA1E7A|nr:uncharacterized protein LOC131889887 isoform X1 [Tigriopus californicus]
MCGRLPEFMCTLANGEHGKLTIVREKMKRPTLRVLVISCALSLAALESVGILLHLLCHEACLNSGHFRIQVNSTTLRRIDRPRKPVWEGNPTTDSPPTSTRFGELGNFEDKVRLSHPSAESTTMASSTTTAIPTTVVPQGSSFEGINAHAQLFAGVVPRMINSFIIRMGRPFQIGAKASSKQQRPTNSSPINKFAPNWRPLNGKPHHAHSSIRSGMKFNGGSGCEKSANFPIKEGTKEEQKESTANERVEEKRDRQIWQSTQSGQEESDKGGARRPFYIFGAKLT